MNLTVENLCFSYHRRPVLHDLTFSAHDGELLAVLGPNGVGKSTLFRCILGMLHGYSGRICIGGDDLERLSQQKLARRIAYIPQMHRPTFGYSVIDTVLMGTTHSTPVFSSPGKVQFSQAQAALRQVGIEDLADRDFSRLSGGQQQLVLIARALAQQAAIFVMDEPTSSLDYGNGYRVLHKIRALADDGYTVLMSTHNPQYALSYAHRILAMEDGTAAALGRTEEVLTAELIQRLYGISVNFVHTKAGQVIIPIG